jgi:hypothetical protein
VWLRFVVGRCAVAAHTQAPFRPSLLFSHCSSLTVGLPLLLSLGCPPPVILPRLFSPLLPSLCCRCCCAAARPREPVLPAGLTSPEVSHQWTIIAAAPEAVIDLGPDPLTSGSRAPFFALHAAFPTGNADTSGLQELLPNVTFEVQVVTVPASDVFPSGWRAPTACPLPLVDLGSAARQRLNRTALCVSRPCTGVGCNLTLALPTAGLQYSLSVCQRLRPPGLPCLRTAEPCVAAALYARMLLLLLHGCARGCGAGCEAVVVRQFPMPFACALWEALFAQDELWG